MCVRVCCVFGGWVESEQCLPMCECRASVTLLPPTRAQAIVATAKFHSPEDAATRILPAISPLCIDPVAEVRAGKTRQGMSMCTSTPHAVMGSVQEAGCIAARLRHPPVQNHFCAIPSPYCAISR